MENSEDLHGAQGAVAKTRAGTVGYDPDFLGLPFPVPMPMPSETLLPHVFRANADMAAKLMDHPHWSAMIDTRESHRCPAVVGLNIDGKKFPEGRLKNPKKKWAKESASVLPHEYQLGEEYYSDNHWDKGHMARRASAAWGDTDEEAEQASRETFYFTNACLQHAKFNQDEWLELEDSVKCLSTRDGRISVFQGPIFSERVLQHMYVEPTGHPRARVPSGFFKVVCAKTDDGELAVRAFIMWQTEYKGTSLDDPAAFETLQAYQVTVREIEQETGLVFSDAIRDANPLSFSPCSQPIPVYSADDVVGLGGEGPKLSDGTQGLGIQAALVNPEGEEERGHEWVSIVNLSTQTQSLDGWAIKVDSHPPVLLPSGMLASGDSVRVQNESLVLPNGGGHIRLYHSDLLVDSVRYSGNAVRKSGEDAVLRFAPETR